MVLCSPCGSAVQPGEEQQPVADAGIYWGCNDKLDLRSAVRDFNCCSFTFWRQRFFSVIFHPSPPLCLSGLSRTTRSHPALSRHRTRCTPRRCGATGWWRRRCPPAPSWLPAPAAPAPSSAGYLWWGEVGGGAIELVQCRGHQHGACGHHVSR